MKKGIHALEGLGYVSAVLIGLAMMDLVKLHLFLVGGLILVIIVLVRLLAFTAVMASDQADKDVPKGGAGKEEVTK
jgi:hypothetical protein